MKRLLFLIGLMFSALVYGQTINIGPDQYAFQFTNNPNFGLFFNATESQYEFRDGSASPIFAIRASNGILTTDLEIDDGADYLVPGNRYAFRFKSNPNYGLFFNSSNGLYEFRNNAGNSSFSIGADNGNLTTSGFVLPGNTAATTEGAIRYNGSDLEGRIGGEWRSLTTSESGSLQDAFDVGNTINTAAEPLAIEGLEGLIVSQGPNASTEGIGVKMFFDPTNISFRCGSVNATAWNEENRGSGSAAFGLSTIASGLGSFATGNQTEASGERSAAFGSQTVASGLNSFAAGLTTTAGGDYSTAFGESNAATGLASFTAGEDNTASGQSSVAFGRNSEASGQNALVVGNNSVASGSSSIAAGSAVDATGTTSAAFGFSNEASGFGSLAAGWGSDAEGDASMAMGRGVIAKSGYEMVVGSFNTDYGPDNPTAWAATDRLFVIGNGTGSNDRSDALVMLKNGNMGLGTNDPTSRLTIENPTLNDIGIRMKGDDNFVGWDGWRIGQVQTNNEFVFNFGSTTRFRMSVLGFRPGTDNLTPLGSASERFTEVFAVNGTINTSDERDKKNIRDAEYGLEEVMKMRPVTFEWKEDHSASGTKVGFVAQDLLEIIPEVVVTKTRVEDGETGEISFAEAKRYGVFYSDLIPVLAKAIQEQQVEIEEAREENADLANENQTLRSELDQLKDRMNRFEQDLVSCCFESGSNASNGSILKENPELGQNIPNPFSESTVIQYYLPENTANAIIRITDMNGNPVEDIRLGDQKGTNQVEFHTQGLASGTYLYSLFVDGKFIATKKMMIAR